MQQWMLVGKFGALGDNRSKLIDPIPFRVGRRPEAALTLPRATVSGMHAEIFTEEKRLFVRDLRSTNGTFINGERITGAAELREEDVVQFADVAFRVTSGSQESDSHTMSEDFCDHALARVQFEKLLREGIVTPYFQPIVDLRTGAIQAFEVLARSRMIGLETPGRMFAAAADLQREADLSDLMRCKGIEVSQQFHEIPPIFLNTHPAEFVDVATWDWVSRLRDMAPTQKLVIEVHEEAVTDVIGVARFRAMLRDFDIGLAFDDFGAGQARIAELADVRPDYLKFDRRIITGLDGADASRQRFVRCLIEAIRDIGVVPLAEGIETPGEHQICRSLGFELAQGYWLGLPSPIDTYREWKSPIASVDSSVRLPLGTPTPVDSLADSIHG
ncbi:MAG: EAL domain-containing protein [Planctomycetaceae bacterium]|nr:EAL domain-containing protein [Planctomycetaceae bacterium]